MVVRSGLDRLDRVQDRLKGARVGLMTGPTGMDRHFRSAIDLLHDACNLTALFSAEHGIRGHLQAGEAYASGLDERTGVPVYAVYGSTHHLTEEMLSSFDVLCFDMQDVGARFYTYLYALSFVMEDCARAGKPIFVFDRINPLGGEKIEGTVLDTRFASYVGMYPLPTRYAMTIGEYALWVRHHLQLDLDLTVVPLEGWRRSMYLSDTGLPWVAPSPNCATGHAALCYIGSCIFEGTNISEGRGTTLPFEYIGAPFLDPYLLEEEMSHLHLPGLHFRPCYFTPTFSKYAGQTCAGVQMHITDRRTAEPVRGALYLLDVIRKAFEKDFAFLQTGDAPGQGRFFIDQLLGGDDYRLGMDAQSLLTKHESARSAFSFEREPFLLYD